MFCFGTNSIKIGRPKSSLATVVLLSIHFGMEVAPRLKQALLIDWLISKTIKVKYDEGQAVYTSEPLNRNPISRLR